jgi:hypothetical protein
LISAGSASIANNHAHFPPFISRACETLAEIRENDPHRRELIAVVMQWKEHLALGQKYIVQDVIGRAINIPSFYNALQTVALGNGNTVSNARLGRWLMRVQGQIVNGWISQTNG